MEEIVLYYIIAAEAEMSYNPDNNEFAPILVTVTLPDMENIDKAELEEFHRRRMADVLDIELQYIAAIDEEEYEECLEAYGE